MCAFVCVFIVCVFCIIDVYGELNLIHKDFHILI